MSSTIRIALYPNSEVRATIGRERAGGDRRGNSVRDFCRDDAPTPTPERVAPLDITSKLSGVERPGFGGLPRPTKFGNNARRTISRCAGVFTLDGIPPGQFLFLTGTIPGSTAPAFEAVARWSSWIVKTIKTWLSDRGALGAYSIYVWEFQRRGALHIHYCVQVEDPLIRERVLREWRDRWASILDGVSERASVDVWARKSGGTWATNKRVVQADAQIVEKSVGAYLSKYLSKSAPTNQSKGGEEQTFHGPVRWWGAARSLLKRCRELTESFEVEGISHLAIRYSRERVHEILNWSENRVFSYWDKSRSTNVLLTYSPDECQTIYNHLKRDIFRWRRAPSNPSSNPCLTSVMPPDLCDWGQQGSNSSKSAPGAQCPGIICQLSLL